MITGAVRRAVLARQAAWAEEASVTHVRGYTSTPAENVFLPLSPRTKAEFRRANGGELEPRGGDKPPKFCALHSSSALACNVFDYWRGRDLTPLARALGLLGTPTCLHFEAKFSTGMRGPPCNLDVVLAGPDGTLTAIESKFTEPFTPKRTATPLSARYLPDTGVSPWLQRGLYACDRVARHLLGNPAFRLLDVSQLVKHILGLHRATDGRLRLLYLYYDVPGEEGRVHRMEVDRFRCAIAGEVDFGAVSYQELLRRLRDLVTAADADYLNYLLRRYATPSGEAVV